MGLMLSSLPPSGVTPEVRGRKGVGVSSLRTLPLQRGVEVSRRAMFAATTGGRLWCSFGPLGLIAFKRYRVMDIEEIKAKVRANEYIYSHLADLERRADDLTLVQVEDALLSDSRIRMHLKDLTLAWLANVTDPGDDEWALLVPWLESIWPVFARGERSPDKFASLVWHHVFGSKSWFHFIDRLGYVTGWLASGNNGLIDMAVNYLRFHQRHASDRVAALLEPYAGQGGEWKERLRYLMEWADHENSRRFFELFLQLIDNGTLDQARDSLAMNGTFWSMLYGLGIGADKAGFAVILAQL
jgi:hypothetical protein